MRIYAWLPNNVSHGKVKSIKNNRFLKIWFLAKANKINKLIARQPKKKENTNY